MIICGCMPVISLLLKNGKFIEAGLTASVIDSPSPYTQALMAAAFEIQADETGLVST